MRLIGAAGRALVGLGVLVLLFTAYQLWGTGITEAHNQAALRAALHRELPRPAARAQTELAKPRRSGAASAAATAPRTATPPVGQPVGELTIPSIGLRQAIVQGVAEPDLAMGPGHYPGTALPGQPGNTAIAGHRTTYAHPFYDLTAVHPGADVMVTTPQGVFVYVARHESVVSPTDLKVLRPTARPTLTLTTCNPRYSAATRLVLRATLARSLLFSGLPRGAAHPGTADRSPTPPGRPPPVAVIRPSPGSWQGAVLLALPLVAVLCVTELARRRMRRRWVALVPGSVASLVALWFFFGALGPLLPPSL